MARQQPDAPKQAPKAVTQIAQTASPATVVKALSTPQEVAVPKKAQYKLIHQVPITFPVKKVAAKTVMTNHKTPHQGPTDSQDTTDTENHQ